MKKNSGVPLLIILCVLTIAAIGLGVWGIVTVLKADIPGWLKFAILKG